MTEHQNEELPDQTPPDGYEPQVEVAPMDPGVYENPGDLIADADAETDAEAESGDADGDDDDANNSD